MVRLSKWTVEALLLSDDLAKLIEANRLEEERAKSGDVPVGIAKEKEMATIIEPSKGKAPQIDDGLYTVTCRGVKSVTVDNDQFGNFEKIELALEILGVTDEDGDPLTLDPRCNRKWNEKATLYQWAQAFGVVASPNEAFNADDLINKQAQALIETPEDGGWPRVTKMTALKKKKGNGDAPFDTEPAPTILNADGTVDFDAFWKAVRAKGISRAEVVSEVNGDIENLMSMEPTQVPILLEHVLTKYA